MDPTEGSILALNWFHGWDASAVLAVDLVLDQVTQGVDVPVVAAHPNQLVPSMSQ